MNNVRQFLLVHRGALALTLTALTVVASVLIVVWSPLSIIATAVCVLFVSLLGFHGAVWLSYERIVIWHVLDYALESITLVSLIVALAGIQQSAIAEKLQAEFSRRKADQAELIYFLKSTITNDCHPKDSRRNIWKPSPEPYPGACARIEAFLPQIEFFFSKETGIDTMTGDDSWARDILLYEAEDAATGSWMSINNKAKSFIEGSRRTQRMLDTQSQLSSEFIKKLAGSDKLQYWQYLLVLVLSLRIARKTGSLLNSKTTQTKLRTIPRCEDKPE